MKPRGSTENRVINAASSVLRQQPLYLATGRYTHLRAFIQIRNSYIDEQILYSTFSFSHTSWAYASARYSSSIEVTDAQRLFDSISTYPSERISSEQRKNILPLNPTTVYLLELALLTSLYPQIIHQKTT